MLPNAAQVFEPAASLLLSPAEGILWRLEENIVGAFRVTVILRVDGHVEEHILSSALRHLQRHHPKLRAAIEEGGDGRLRYRFADNGFPIPLEVKDYEEAELPWREETRRLMEIRFPSVGPRAAVSVLRCPSRCYSEVLLTVHHAVADGVSGIMLMDDLMTEYARVEADPEAPFRPALPAITAPRARTSNGWRGKLWLFRRFLGIQRIERSFRQTPLPQASNVSPQSQWVHWVFPREYTVALIRRCRKEKTSLGAVLVAASCCGLMDCLPLDEALFKCQFPFNIRDLLVGPAGPVTGQDLGCFASIMNSFYQVRQQPSFWNLARHIHQDQQAFVQQGGPASYYNLAAATATRLFQSIAPKLLPASDRRVTLLATNYGVLSMDQAYGSLSPRECTLTFKNDVVGPPLVMEALAMGQRLNVGFVGDGLDQAFWEKLHVAVRKHLDAAVMDNDTNEPSGKEV